MQRAYRLGRGGLIVTFAMLGIACTQARPGHAPPPTVVPLSEVSDAAARHPDAGPSAEADRDGSTLSAAQRAAPDHDTDAALGGSADAAQSAATDAGCAPASCMPSGGGPHYVLEGEAVSLTVTCSIGSTDPLALHFTTLPDGAHFDQETARLTWTPGLAQAGKHELEVRDERSGDVGKVQLHVIDRFDAADNRGVDRASYHEEYGLPVIHLTTDRGLNEDEYTPAAITYRGHTYEGAEAKLRGATSQSYPKRSFTLKFTKADKFNEPSFAGGFLKKRKIALTTTFDDNSYVRQRLGYELWNRLDRQHIQMQAYNAVLFLNGSYFGLYTVTDHINGYLMEEFGHSQDGDLYKARSANANFRANLNGSQTLKENLHVGYTKEEGFPEADQPGAFDNLDAFVRWVIESSPEQLAAEAPSRIAEHEYVGWWIFLSFGAADDSISKNSNHYRDPLLAGSVWHVIPWDLNHSFGQDWNTERVTPDVTKPEGLYPRQNQLFEKLLAGPLAPSMRQRYAEVLASKAYAIDDVIALYDGMVAEVKESALRDELKWGERYRNFGHWNKRTDLTKHEQEVSYVRGWIRERHAYLQTLYPPVESSAQQ
jgi:spore coat protein H